MTRFQIFAQFFFSGWLLFLFRKRVLFVFLSKLFGPLNATLSVRRDFKYFTHFEKKKKKLEPVYYASSSIGGFFGKVRDYQFFFWIEKKSGTLMTSSSPCQTLIFKVAYLTNTMLKVGIVWPEQFLKLLNFLEKLSNKL